MTYQECIEAACAASKDEKVRLAWVYMILDGGYQWGWEGDPTPQKASRRVARIYWGKVTFEFKDAI